MKQFCLCAFLQSARACPVTNLRQRSIVGRLLSSRPRRLRSWLALTVDTSPFSHRCEHIHPHGSVAQDS